MLDISHTILILSLFSKENFHYNFFLSNKKLIQLLKHQSTKGLVRAIHTIYRYTYCSYFDSSICTAFNILRNIEHFTSMLQPCFMKYNLHRLLEPRLIMVYTLLQSQEFENFQCCQRQQAVAILFWNSVVLSAVLRRQVIA
jgi:hypothetical protein